MRDDRVYLEHILDAIGAIGEFTAQGKEVFFRERKDRDAVVKNLEVIGEAVRNLSEKTKERYPDVPWLDIADMRNKLIHEYFGVKAEVVWDTVQRDLPALREQTVIILRDLES